MTPTLVACNSIGRTGAAEIVLTTSFDGSTMEANAASRAIVQRDAGESYRAMLA